MGKEFEEITKEEHEECFFNKIAHLMYLSTKRVNPSMAKSTAAIAKSLMCAAVQVLDHNPEMMKQYVTHLLDAGPEAVELFVMLFASTPCCKTGMEVMVVKEGDLDLDQADTMEEFIESYSTRGMTKQ